MGDTKAPEQSKITEADPFVNVFDDGSFKPEIQYNTAEEAADAVVDRWKAGTKQMRVSELPKK